MTTKTGLDPTIAPEGHRDGARLLLREYRSFVGRTLTLIDSLEDWRPQARGHELRRVERLIDAALAVLIEHGIRPTARVGAPLDLRYHEVLDVHLSEEVEPDTILDVVQAGYEMVPAGIAPSTLRQAKVVVSGRPEHEPNREEKEDGPGGDGG